MLGKTDFVPQLKKIQWVKFRNDAATTAPGGAILRITGFDVTDVEEPFFTIGQPNTFGSQYMHAINDELDVPAGSYGLCSLGQMVPALYDSGDGTPAFSEAWGPRSGSWKLKKNTPGFKVVGVASSARTLALVFTAPMLEFVGVTDVSISKGGSSGNVSVHADGGPMVEADTGENIGAYSRFVDVGSGVKVRVAYNPWNDSWEIVDKEC